MKCAKCGQPIYESKGFLWHVSDDFEDHVVALASRPVQELTLSAGVDGCETAPGRPTGSALPRSASAVPPPMLPPEPVPLAPGGSETEGELRFAWGDR